MYTIEVFQNQSCDSSDHGEGETFLGSFAVGLVFGLGNFVETLTVAPTAGRFVSATATDPDGNTLEFGNCFPVSEPGSLFTVDSLADDVDALPNDGVCETAAGECTLRAAIGEVNALAAGGGSETD